MVRVVKQPDERRSEIIQAARTLFMSNGYEKTSVNDIVQQIGVAKGTVYHYFKSKEEIADAVIQHEIDQIISSFEGILSTAGMTGIQKLMKVILLFTETAEKHYSDGLMRHLHDENNRILHQKMKIHLITEFVPTVTEIVNQGIQEGTFATDYPEEISKFLLVGLHFMLDPSLFPMTREQFSNKLNALPEIYEKMLGAPTGSFSFVKDYTAGLFYPTEGK